MTPEKLHLALNHFVFLFPLAALIPLVVGLVLKNRATILCGLSIALVGSLLTGVVMGTGEEAYERYEDGPVAAYLDPGAEAALEHHEDFAHTWSKALYLLAAGSLAALVIGFWKPKWLTPAAVVVVVLCLAGVVVGVAIADTGGKIRRPDFRDGASTAETATSGATDHDHD